MSPLFLRSPLPHRPIRALPHETGAAIVVRAIIGYRHFFPSKGCGLHSSSKGVDQHVFRAKPVSIGVLYKKCKSISCLFDLIHCLASRLYVICVPIPESLLFGSTLPLLIKQKPYSMNSEVQLSEAEV